MQDVHMKLIKILSAMEKAVNVFHQQTGLVFKKNNQ